MPPLSPPPLTLRRTYGWLALVFVASGAPYGLLTDTLSQSLARNGVSPGRITALASDVGLPWTLKFLWAPLVDAFGRRKGWIQGSQVTIAVLLFGFSTLPPGDTGTLATLALLGMAVASATQDIAADAYGIEVLSARSLGEGGGIKVGAYRVGLLLAGGILAGRADALGWPGVWRVAAGVFALFAASTFFLPSAPRTRTAGTPLVEPLRALLRTPGIVGIAAFVLLFKACDYAMPSSLTKTLLVHRGFSNEELGDVLTPLGIGASILGSLVGGWWTSRVGLGKALLVLGALQAGSNLAYAGAAAVDGKAALWGAAVFEQLCAGLGTAPFVAFLMTCSQRAHAGTHYALLTALMGFGRWLFGRWSGAGAEALGYPGWFAATFLVALPAFLLLPIAYRAIARREAEEAAGAAEATGRVGAPGAGTGGRGGATQG